ncbi:TRAP transporter substrate-binding protein [Pseudooceanicola sp.]|jgi:TRAP-type C4-dicarboxylate transport system substrate-binding protein|uniref:TRAP transporter substrate-binding protein n=1 Tax=Pseudooceanicola sp. TaxID=1914328 RepID=UPI004058FD83
MKTTLTAALLVGASALAVQAQDITLRVADSLPVDHYMTRGVLEPLMAQVGKATGGAVEFQHFPAEQLGKAKDLLSLAQDGVADIAYVGASYVADKLPLSSVGELPEAFTTSCEGTKAFWEIAKPGGALDQAEYAPQGVRALAVLVLPPYQVFSAREITGLDSLKGQKVRATGAAKQIALTKLGAVPVAMPAPETREALSRGTVDAIAFPHGSILPYDLVPHLKTATEGANFGSFVATWMISQSKFDSLPENVQTALTEAGAAATLNGCAETDAATDSDKQTIADGGVTFVTLPEADAASLAETMATVGDEWAAELDGRGKAGTEILKAFRNALPE